MAASRSRLARFVRRNGLSLVMFSLFALCWVGQSVAGCRTYNDDRRHRGLPALSYGDYVFSSHFVEATFENWESEFLQMGAYVLLTVWLRQAGSPESKSFDEPDAPPTDRRARNAPRVPWPVRRGGWVLKVYENSLALALFGLFALSFALHAAGGARQFNEEARAHGEPTVSGWGYLVTSQFWFESLQNWQSEFLSVGALVVLSIYLRQKGSPQSKPVAAPHAQTGGD